MGYAGWRWFHNKSQSHALPTAQVSPEEKRGL